MSEYFLTFHHMIAVGKGAFLRQEKHFGVAGGENLPNESMDRWLDGLSPIIRMPMQMLCRCHVTNAYRSMHDEFSPS